MRNAYQVRFFYTSRGIIGSLQKRRELIAGEFEQRPAALLAALEGAAADPAGGELLDLAALFYNLSARGPAERKACLQILAAFSAYVDAAPRLD